MTKAIVIPAGRQPAAVVDFEPGSRRGLAAFINDRAAAATVGLSAFGLDRQMAVLLYDDDAANRGELLNGTVLELLPDSFIAPSGQTLIFGNAVIVGFRDGRGLWTSVSPELVTELVRANRFWVEVRRWPQGPGEQVGPVYDSRSTAIGARDRWRNVILDRGIAGVEVSVAAEVGPGPCPRWT